MSILIISAAHSAPITRSIATEMLNGAISTSHAKTGMKPELKIHAKVKGQRRKWSGSSAAVAGSKTNYADIIMSSGREVIIKTAAQAIEDKEVTSEQVAIARKKLSIVRNRQDSTLMLLGKPPEPLTLAERWRNRNAVPVSKCWSKCCVRSTITGYICVDDYNSNAIACNPRLLLKADNKHCPAKRKSTVVDHEDTIIRRYIAHALNFPLNGQSDVYFSLSLPVVPSLTFR